jgi:iron complex outermembrane receptor protein
MAHSHSHVRIALRLTVAAAALAASPAIAQEAPTASAEQLAAETTDAAAPQGSQDIVVTARRRAETALDVPIALTAYSGEALQRAGALDITDLAQTTPNVTLEVSRGTNSTLTAFIRGVGQQDPVAGFEAGVGLYLDDVYLNRPQAAVLDIYDVERIEILRGPQGTLYGRNTIGGAVKYVTRRLGDDPTLTVRGVYGSYDQADLVVTGSAPVIGDVVKIGGGFARLSRGGFGENLTTGEDNYNRDIWAGRATLQIEPSSSAFFRISGDYTKDDSNARGGHRLIAGLRSGIPVLDNVYDTRAGLRDPGQEVEAYGVSALAELKPAEWLTFRSITGWRKDDSGTPIDFDALPAVDVDVPAFYNNDQFSQEVQLLVETGGFSGLIGGYYLDASSRTVFDVRLPGGVTALTFGDVETDTTAIFGDFTYDFSRMFSVSVGGRYTWDRRQSTVLRQTFLGGGSPFFNGTGILFATTSDFNGTRDFSKFTPRASVAFKPNDDNNLYASYSQGFKGGGFDPRGVTTACRTPTGAACNRQQIFDFMTFDPETVDSYEIGYKASLFDRRVNIAVAAFHADYTDVQVPGSIGTVLNGQQTFIGITTNAGRARIRGVEFEGNVVAARDFAAGGDRLSFAWTLGYVDARYTEFIDARGINVADNRRFQNTPEWTASGTLAYGAPLGGGRLDTQTTVSYRSDVQQFELATPGLDQPGFALWDAALSWTTPDDRLTFAVNARNILDKRYVVSGYNFLAQNPDTGAFLPGLTGGPFRPTLGQEGVLTAYYGNPRQVFGSITFRY